MEKQEMLQYLASTGLYESYSKRRPYADMYYEEKMMDSDKTIPISELVERFIEIDKEFNGLPWNLRRILTQIDMIIPIEDRKESNDEM